VLAPSWSCVHGVLTNHGQPPAQLNREFAILCWYIQWTALGCSEKLYEPSWLHHLLKAYLSSLWFASCCVFDNRVNCGCAATWTIPQQWGSPSHTHKINIKHLNSTLISTKLPVNDTQVNTWIAIYTTISNKICRRKYRRIPPHGASVHYSTNNHKLNNIRLFLVLA
jgi:hypothetical protein